MSNIVTPLEIMHKYAWSMVGQFYRWGGDDPSGWDCSGLVIEILSSVGEAPRHDTTAQGLYNHFLTRSRQSGPVLGALAFYGGATNRIRHVAFCISELCCFEAGGGDSTTVSTERAVEQNAFVRVRPVYSRKDCIAILRPAYRFEGRKGA